jgi:transmembrane sensor
MSEPVRDLESALSRVAQRWDGDRTERTLKGLHRKQRARHRTRLAAAGGGVAVAVAAVLVLVLRAPTRTESAAVRAVVPPPASSLHIELSDGSDVFLHDADARVQVEEVSPERVTLALRVGQAQFDVRHRADRMFRVQSGDVTVEVLGTAFEMKRDANRTHVVVLRGRVAVAWPQGRTELAAGEAGWFPRVADATQPARTLDADAAPDAGLPPMSAARSAKTASRKPRAVATANPWREPAERGDFDHAYELLAKSERPVADDVEELLLAADAARLSGHPEAALTYLRRVVDKHREDSRAPLAAFTLGGVLMQQLGQPREAEAAFARARELSLNASLAEDALARQVEAAYRAGDAAHARSLAREYLGKYPKGRRVHAVQRFGGLTD